MNISSENCVAKSAAQVCMKKEVDQTSDAAVEGKKASV